MAITFRTTYDEDGNPQRVKIGSGTSFESGQTYSPNVDSRGQVQDIQTDSGGRAIADPQLSHARFQMVYSHPPYQCLVVYLY